MHTPARTVARLGLVRHGATDWTLTGRYQGRADPPLCAQGFAEAGILTEKLRDHAIERIVASPLQRARQTAAVLAEAANLSSPCIDDNLNEIDYGNWEGLTQPQIKSAWPSLLCQWKQAPETLQFPDGESVSGASSRVRTALDAWQRAARTEVVLLVTHATWIKLALIETGHLSIENFRHFVVPTGTLIWLPGGDLSRTRPI